MKSQPKSETFTAKLKAITNLVKALEKIIAMCLATAFAGPFVHDASLPERSTSRSSSLELPSPYANDPRLRHQYHSAQEPMEFPPNHRTTDDPGMLDAAEIRSVPIVAPDKS